jgi:hypothetical protein
MRGGKRGVERREAHVQHGGGGGGVCPPWGKGKGCDLALEWVSCSSFFEGGEGEGVQCWTCN